MQSESHEFRRLDESDDALFYATDHFTSHLDDIALDTVKRIIGTLVIEEESAILDLMAGWDSHLPQGLAPSSVVGLGLNGHELSANKALSGFILHDLNQNPMLPFASASFDVVLCTASVDYLVRPDLVFAEVGRVLKPGGLFLITFSNRGFEEKVTEAWRESNEAERVWMIKDWFNLCGDFEDPQVFVSKGRPRSEDDKCADLGITSDPVYAVYAEAKGGDPARTPRPEIPRQRERPPQAEIDRRSTEVAETLCCPYCGERMNKWEVPQTPFTEWDNEYMYVCFNDQCPYMEAGWEVMGRQGNYGISYRMMYNPDRDHLMPVAVPSTHTMRDGIID